MSSPATGPAMPTVSVAVRPQFSGCAGEQGEVSTSSEEVWPTRSG
ncbi:MULTISPECIES: hypothetical protein [Bacteria]